MEQLQTVDGIFTNNIKTGQTAQQVYDEWLINKDRPLIVVPDNTALQSQIFDLTTQLVTLGVL